MENEQLIECVRKYEFLYNLQHPKYMDNVKKENAWKQIADQVGQPSSACKSRWQALRDSFRRALNKRREKIELKQRWKKWKYEDEMSFVAPFFLERKCLDVVDIPSDDNDGASEEILTCEVDLMKPEEESIEEDITINNSVVDNLDSYKRKVEPDVKVNKVVKRPKTHQSASAVLMAKLLEDQKKRPPQREYCEIDRFFLNIADTVKKFSLYEQALVKKKIFSFVSEMELQHLAPSTATSSSHSHVPPISSGNSNEQSLRTSKRQSCNRLEDYSPRLPVRKKKTPLRKSRPRRQTSDVPASEHESTEDDDTKEVSIKEEIFADEDDGEGMYKSEFESVTDIVVKEEPTDDWSDPVD